MFTEKEQKGIAKLDTADQAMSVSRRHRKIERELEPKTCPFTVCVDTREQAPWHFTGIEEDKQQLIVPLCTSLALETGDYSILGHQNEITIERKSPGDFRSSITADRARFEREMERMREMVAAGGYAAVVIEADFEELMQVPEISRISPTTIARTMQSWSIRYGVHFWPMRDRRVAEVWTFRLLQMFWRHKRHEGVMDRKDVESPELILNF